MLSRLTKISRVIRLFSSQAPIKSLSEYRSIMAVKDSNQVQEGSAEYNELLKTEKIHHDYFRQELKEDFAADTEINFEQEENGTTLIMQSGTSNSYLYKLGQTIAAAGLFNIVSELSGMASYPVLALSVGAFAAGGALSYANYFQRIHNRISQIHKTNDGKLKIVFYKASNGFIPITSLDEQEIIVEKKDFRYNISFGCKELNILHKYNGAIWCRVQNKNYWFDRENASFNSHLYQDLF